MKKILMMLMCISLLAGCSTKDASELDNKTDNNNNDNVTENDNNSAKDVVDDWYNRFESEMRGKSVTYSSRDKLDATTIGGAEGYRYTTENGNIDVYRFEDTEKLNQIVKDKKIKIDNKEYNVEVRDKMVIVTDNLKDDIKDIFHGMK